MFCAVHCFETINLGVQRVWLVWEFAQSYGQRAICLFFNVDIQHYEVMDGPVEDELR